MVVITLRWRLVDPRAEMNDLMVVERQGKGLLIKGQRGNSGVLVVIDWPTVGPTGIAGDIIDIRRRLIIGVVRDDVIATVTLTRRIGLLDRHEPQPDFRGLVPLAEEILEI